MVNEWVVVADGISAGFVSPDAAFDMRGNLGIGQLSGVNSCRLGFDDFVARASSPWRHGQDGRATFTDKGKAP